MVKKDYDEKRGQEAMSLEDYFLLKAEYAKANDMSERAAIIGEIYRTKNEIGIASKEEKEMLEKLIKLIERHEKLKLNLEKSVRNSGNLLIN